MPDLESTEGKSSPDATTEEQFVDGVETTQRSTVDESTFSSTKPIDGKGES